MGMLPANLRPDLDALRVDVAVGALRDVVKDGWSVLGLSTGMVDALADQTGIASLGGATYSGAGKTLGNPGGYSSNLCVTAGACSANATYAANYPYNLIDGNLGTAWYSYPAAVPCWWQYTFPTPRAISKVTFTAYGASRDPQDFQIQYYNGSSWVTAATFNSPGVWVAGEVRSFTFANAVAATQWRAYITSVVSDGYVQFAEISMHEAAAPSAVTAVSTAFALGFQPSRARIIAPMEVGSGTIGTDGLLDLSRDGSNWAPVQLSDLGKFDASTRIVGGLVDLAGQPAGSSIYWRWRTTAGIAQALHGVWIQCK